MAAKSEGLVTVREDGWHWLSSQRSASSAYSMDFEDGWLDSDHEFYEFLVRPVRSLILQ
ncbi:hypothetical protein D3C81_2245060 [compost metagenome]